MLTQIINWFRPPPPTATMGGTAHRPEIEQRVRAIERSLDSHKGGSRAAPRDYNLVYTDAHTGARVYLGGVAGLQKRSFMDNIGAVVSMVDEGRFPLNYVERYVKPEQGLFYASLDDAPNQDIGRYFDRTRRFIEHHVQRGVDVYIHCVAGMSRSSTVAANWLMHRHGLNVMDALLFLKSKRPIVRPNRGFIRQLVTRRPE